MGILHRHTCLADSAEPAEDDSPRLVALAEQAVQLPQQVLTADE